MKKWAMVLLTLLAFSSVLAGCASDSKESFIRCPKCAGFFFTPQGADTFKYMQGEETRR